MPGLRHLQIIKLVASDPSHQMKSLQFRSIAPKAAAVVPSPSPLTPTCQPLSALPEATTASSPKSILVPTQNYALMQIAGQDGTFSLVALPPSVSSQTPQQQTQSIQKNLKLPIPRYPSARSKRSSEKVKSPIAVSTKAAFNVPVLPQTKSVGSGTSAVSKLKLEETKHTRETTKESLEKVFLIDPASSDISVTAILPEKALLCPGSKLEQTSDGNERPASASLVQNLHYPSAASSNSTSNPPEETKTTVGLCQTKSTAAQPQGSITVLSPAIFSKAVQIIPSPPKGKLPILPYAKMKSSLIPATKLSSLSPERKGFCGQAGVFTSGDTTSKNMENAEVLRQNQVLNSKPSLVPVTLQKPPGKKRGRKRKTMEDILAFEARKKRSLSFFRRRVPEKPPAVIPGFKQKEVDISKKYRTIRPKPMLVMETVPQLVSLPTVTSDGQEQELLLGHQLSTSATTKALDCSPQTAPVTLHLRAGSNPKVFIGSRPLHRCSICNRCFQFKHHLQNHMNTHTNSRPYICPLCRKAYAHRGSLSTHMKLHHSEVRPRRSLCCEFCDKVFGYVGVYFRHLREVHRVVLTVEPSISRHEDDVSLEGTVSPEPSDEQDREDPVELQIKCGRCQATTPTFADMKMHLLYVHEEEVHIRAHDGVAQCVGREVENELVKHAAHYWRQLNEKRNLVKCGSCDEEFFSFSKLKKHIMSHHRVGDGEGDETRSTSPENGIDLGVLAAGAAFNCVLCSKVLDTKELIMEHWRSHHHCEQPVLLWDALSSYSGQEEGEVDGDLDTPSPSPH
ncbi:zinc finger protein 438 isoform X1 [Poecilia latipinna]|uniref:Zinc finger protein 438 n=2 Tax=Poecilia latipinna TaxID=48699 RepID=A0A3B3TW08_9TELE|nr:PREDICTED: zinc finger protein 438-like isoform X1 [Poecilia latipinna]